MVVLGGRNRCKSGKTRVYNTSPTLQIFPFNFDYKFDTEPQRDIYKPVLGLFH